MERADLVEAGAGEFCGEKEDVVLVEEGEDVGSVEVVD